MKPKNPNAVALGRLGGIKSNQVHKKPTQAQILARRANAEKARAARATKPRPNRTTKEK